MGTDAEKIRIIIDNTNFLARKQTRNAPSAAQVGVLERLFAMVCIALVWAYLVGEHKDIHVKPIKILKHGRRAKSLVKHGHEEISNMLFRPTYTPKFDVFKFLSCT